MKLDIFKTKKVKAIIVAVVGGAILQFFPGSADTVSEIMNTLGEILMGVSDKIQPEAIINVVQP